MTGSAGSDSAGSSRSRTPWPSRRDPSQLPSVDDSPSTTPLSDDERKERLQRRVTALTREGRARVRRQKDLEATLVRGNRVNNRLHFTVVLVLAGVALALTRGGTIFFAAGLVAAACYALFWIFLTQTGGEEIERLSIDEFGRFDSVKSGRDVERRGDVLRVVIPVLIIAASGWVTAGLIRDIAFPPPPECNATAEDPPGSCLKIPNLVTLIRATAPIPQASGSHAPSPGASASAGPSAGASAAASPAASQPAESSGGTLNVDETRLLQRVIRVLQLVPSLGILLLAIWFLRRMLTGRWVAFIRPIHHRLSDE